MSAVRKIPNAMSKAYRLSLVVGVVASLSAAGAVAEAEQAHDLLDLELGELLEQTVTTATKTAQKATEAPANISITTAEEIRRAGYRSVGEALEMIPGLAVNTNHVFVNVGVRGVSGGLRGDSRHVKVLIDGHPAAFRPDAQNFLGPELVPIEIVERIEVIRSPSSALYGRNAFLGVVNVVTKKAVAEGPRAAATSGARDDGAEDDDRSHWAVRGNVGTIREGLGGGGEVLLVDKSGPWCYQVAAFLGYEDRSGLFLPIRSPRYIDYLGNDTSRNDVARPYSLLGALGYDLGRGGSLRLQGSLQNLDAGGEFLDDGPLSHRTRVHLRNGFVRLGYSVGISRVDLDAYAAYSAGGQGPNDAILPVVDGRPTSQLVKRDFGYEAFDGGIEGRVRLLERSSALAGVEYSHEVEQTRANIFISQAGTTLRGASYGDVGFHDVGAYAQVLWADIDRLQLAGNVRYDHHEIFGGSFNYRAAVVYSPLNALTLRAMSASSYRPATPEQLYGPSVRPGGVEGAVIGGATAQDLTPQTARAHELSASWSQKSYRVQLDLYVAEVFDRIEYLLREGNLQPANLADSNTFGGELSFRLQRNGLLRAIDVGLNASLSLQHTEITPDEELAAQQLTPREHHALEINELYPPWMVKWSVDIGIPRLHVDLQARMAIYGPRLESQSNQWLGRPFADSPLLELPVSYPLHLALSSRDLRLWRGKPTRVQLVINDLLNTRGAEPGYTGIRIPALGRRVMLSVRQDL